MLSVLKSGPFVSLQSWGEFGRMSEGVTRGGATDEHAYGWGNHLLRNSFNVLALEITMGGFEGVFDIDTEIVVTGAEMGFKINGSPCRNWKVYQAMAGDRIELGASAKGLRSYLSVSGGFDGEPGRSVVKGEKLSVRSEQATSWESAVGRLTPFEFVPEYRSPVILKLLPSNTVKSDVGARQAVSDGWKFEVSSKLSRMGCFLEGSTIRLPVQGILSEGVSRGTVQVLPSGQAVVLLNEHQTIGGYPKIGCLTHRSCNRLAQCQPGDEVSFEFTTVAEAQRERREFLRFFGVKQESLPSG